MDFKLNDGIYITKEDSDDYLMIIGDSIIESSGSLFNQRNICCRLKSRSMGVCISSKSLELLYPDSHYENGIVDLDDQGRRWEGVTFNGVPCGFGKQFDEEGNLCYEGFMYGDRRVCYGTIYYPDLNRVEYSGYVYNNMKHGYGKLYNRQGLLVSDCFWSCDERVDKTLDSRCKNFKLHSIMEHMVIAGDNRLNMDEFFITSYPYLKSIRIYKSSLINLSLLRVIDCKLLEEFSCSDVCYFDKSGYFSIRNCPNLVSIYINNSFHSGSMLSISSSVCFQ